ncbi:MAG: transcriptional repressor [Treponema sp.]|jgi:Fur family ferric uptake transcriptional regulator|nr:transcriptional repressor [Treponema sp.]
MERASHYQTRQGELILDYLGSLGGSHVTAGNIAGHFERLKPPIGKTTVYRHLEKLAAAGKIRRYFLAGTSACYQYIAGSGECKNHFHLKCETCGELFHLDCGLLEDVADHVRKKHRFAINSLKTVFYGTCKRCLTAKKRREKQ